MKTRRTWSALPLLLLPFGLVACESTKSSTPLSPSLAGPIAGVTVTAPTPLTPANGNSIKDKEQPITLVFANPNSNSPRPVTLRLQVAVDAGFTNVVHA